MTIAHQGWRAGSAVDWLWPRYRQLLTARSLFARLGGLVALATIVGGTARAQCGVQELGVLDAGTGVSSDQFGDRLAMTERFLVVVNSTDQTSAGTPGSISVLERTGPGLGAWEVADKLIIEGLDPGILQNASIAIDGEVLIVGVGDESSMGLGAGAAFVFERSTDGSRRWPQTAKLTASDGQHGDQFGLSVDVAGDCILVGAPSVKRAGFKLGAAYVFSRTTASAQRWAESQKLMPAELGIGSRFGWTVAVESDRIVVGAWSHTSTAPAGGAVFCYTLRDRLWVKEQVLAPEGLATEDDFGSGIALAGDDLIIGAQGDDTTAKNAGACYTYSWSGDSWSFREKLVPMGASEETYTGALLALDANRLFVGSPIEYANGSFAGAVIEYRRESRDAPWVQTAFIEPSDSAPWDTFGVVAAADGILAVGAGKVFDPGAVYLFSSRGQPTVTTYCQPTAGSLPDCLPQLDTVGVPTSSLLSTFEITSQAPGAQVGLFLYTTAASALPDLRSIGVCLPPAPVRRSGVLWSGGSPGACDGTLALDWNTFALGLNDPLLTVPGTTVHGQFVWYDFFAPSSLTWSDAVAFQICP